MMKYKKGSVTLFLTWLILTVIIITITAVVAPMGALFNTEMYKAGEDILSRTNQSLQGINDSVVRGEVMGVVNSAQASAQDNIEVNANMFKYSWVLVVALTALVLFIFTRRQVEYSTGGFT